MYVPLTLLLGMAVTLNACGEITYQDETCGWLVLEPARLEVSVGQSVPLTVRRAGACADRDGPPYDWVAGTTSLLQVVPQSDSTAAVTGVAAGESFILVTTRTSPSRAGFLNQVEAVVTVRP
jgi:hypothetical protein